MARTEATALGQARIYAMAPSLRERHGLFCLHKESKISPKNNAGVVSNPLDIQAFTSKKR
jgi:hypothetical protein